MLCQNCGENEANVRYTQVINGVKKQMNLCSKCAEELGIDNMDFNMPISFSSFLSDMFDDYGDEYLPTLLKVKNLTCDNCNLNFEDFINNGKFGCEKCYENFESRINSILKNIHGVDRHSGRVAQRLLDYSKDDTNKKEEVKKENTDNFDKTKNKKELEIEKLKERLDLEIKEERYEDAAKTRDEIKKLEK